MRLLREWIRQVLSEGRFEDRVDQVMSDANNTSDFSHIQDLADGLTAVGLKNVGYFNWGINQIRKSRATERNTIVSEILSLIQDFHSLRQGLPKRDIMQYETLGELRGDIEEAAAKRAEKKQRSSELSQLASIASENLEKVISESEFLIGGNTPEQLRAAKLIVVVPGTTFASQYWGNPHEFACDINIAQGITKWCTSATRSENYYEKLSKINTIFFYVINKSYAPSHPYYKVALAVRPLPTFLDYLKLIGVDIRDYDYDEMMEALHNTRDMDVEFFDALDESYDINDFELLLEPYAERVMRVIIDYLITHRLAKSLALKRLQ